MSAPWVNSYRPSVNDSEPLMRAPGMPALAWLGCRAQAGDLAVPGGSWAGRQQGRPGARAGRE
jgi:hypothetical protein